MIRQVSKGTILYDNTVSSVFSSKQIQLIEQHYNAVYVTDVAMPAVGGGYVNFPSALFWQSEAHPQGSNYFVLHPDEEGHLKIYDGAPSIKEPFKALMIDNDIVIYSVYRHDRVSYLDYEVDGGRDYFKRTITDNGSKEVTLSIIDGIIYVSSIWNY